MTSEPGMGARWLRCDLHVHTPFDGEKKFGVDVRGAVDAFKKEKTERLAKIAEDFIKACRSSANGAGMDVVALTDHNSIDGYTVLRPFFDSIGRQAVQAGNPMPTILPGVEFSVGGERPLHFLVVFAADTDAELIDRAISHVFGARDRFDSNSGVPCATGQSVDDFLDKLYAFCHPPTGERQMHMVVLPAHADSNSGVIRETSGELAREAELAVSVTLWDEMKGHLRERVITRRDWHGFQTRKPYSKLPQAYRDLLARWNAARLGQDWEQLSKQEKDEIRGREHWPLIDASDPHNYEAVGNRFTWLKMEVPDVEGIRLSLLDPESRLRRMSDGPPGQDYPRITRVKVENTDFFPAIDLPLSPCLTTLIGGRGSGKSTVIELVRYALDRFRKDDFGGEDEQAIRRNITGLLKSKKDQDFGQSEGVLLPGHQVVVDIVLAGRSYRATRRTNELTITSDPDTEGEEVADLDVRALIQPRILSQRQISQIARDPAAQRRELDAHIDPEQRRQFDVRRTELLQQIRQLQLARDRLETGLKSLPSRKTELQTITDQIAYLEQGGRREVFERFQHLDRERRWLEDRIKVLRMLAADLTSRAEELEEGIPSPVARPSALDRTGWLAEVDQRVDQVLNQTSAALRAQADRIEQQVQAIEAEQTERWTPDFEAARNAYEALREELERRGIDFGQHRKLLQQRALIEREVGDLEQSKGRLLRTVDELEAARNRLATLHEDRLVWRRGQADALEQADADVRLEVRPFQDRAQLNEALQHWFSGSGMREGDREALLDYVLHNGNSVVQRLGALARAIRADARNVARGEAPGPEDTETGRLLGDEYRSRFTGYFWRIFANGDRLQLGEMEQFVPDDLVVMHARGPDGHFKPITQGSLGQRSTAILSLVLSSGHQPLIVDQPEDDLDNKYIYDVVVDLLRHRKFSRQIVVATHNANIPVNGDAELIVALEVPLDQRTGSLAACGSIDNDKVKDQVSTIMEGSAQAFRLRRERYGY